MSSEIERCFVFLSAFILTVNLTTNTAKKSSTENKIHRQFQLTSERWGCRVVMFRKVVFHRICCRF